MEQKQIVVELHQHRAAVVDPWAAGLAKASSDIASNASCGVNERMYLHIGDPVFSPWSATFKLLSRRREEANEFGEIELEAANPI